MRLLNKVIMVCALLAFAVPNAFAVQKLTADIVVVGGGFSGLSAALTAVRGGASVIVFEKLPGLGGAGNYPEGSTGVGTKMQARAGYDTSVDKVFSAAIDFHHWRANAAVIRTLLENSGETIDRIEDMGVEFKGIKTTFPEEKSLHVWHCYKHNGASVVRAMQKEIYAKGGKIFLETPVTKLMTDKSGRVIGVYATDTAYGDKYEVKAKGGVILATGGFESNKKMLAQYVTDSSGEGMYEPIFYRGPVLDGREGDGINMAKTVGAGLAGMQTVAGNSPYLDDKHLPLIFQFNGSDSLKQTRAALSQPFLWVNQTGDRFYNESQGSSFTNVYNAMTSNGGVMYSVFDESMKQRMINSGPLIPFNAIVVVGQKMTELDQGIQTGIEQGYAFKANTLEELAKKIGVDVSHLKKSVASVNKYASEKKDPEWGRKPEHIVAFQDQGPYYALKGIRAFFLTLGGVKINTEFQALTTHGQPVKGLYVTGQDMGGLYDSSYDLLVEGSASGFALTSGRLAAQNIIKNELGR
ncbi:MAG: FAD-dependent oxidoreductase [Deferribacterales bacterium]